MSLPPDLRLFNSCVILVDTPMQIACLLCEQVSAHPRDVQERYCGACHLFHDDVKGARERHEQGITHQCRDWQTARGACAICDWDARGGATPSTRPTFRPDFNGECLNCDEWGDEHHEPDCPGLIDEMRCCCSRPCPPASLPRP